MENGFEKFGFVVREVALGLLLEDVEHVDGVPAELEADFGFAIDGVGNLAEGDGALRRERRNEEVEARRRKLIRGISHNLDPFVVPLIGAYSVINLSFRPFKWLVGPLLGYC